MRIWLLCFSFCLACGGEGLSAAEKEQQPSLDSLCACKDEACVTKYASEIANSVREREVKVSDAEAAAITKKVFACSKKARANFATGGEEAEAVDGPKPGGEPGTDVPSAVTEETADQIQEEELKKKVEIEAAALEKLAAPTEILAAFEKETTSLCGCSAGDCFVGAMPRAKALFAALENLSSADAAEHKAAINAASNKHSKCLQKVIDKKIKEEAKVTDVGEALIKATTQYADAGCACTTLACSDAAKKAYEKQTSSLKPKTSADSLNEKMMTAMTRAMKCHQDLYLESAGLK